MTFQTNSVDKNGLARTPDGKLYVTSVGTASITGGSITGVTGAPYVWAQSKIPVINAGSGTMGNNGALTLGTPLATTYANCYILFPAGAIAAGVPAAPDYYYVQMSSTTVGTVFNNLLSANVSTKGEPQIPASPTAFATTGPGAFTAGVGASTALTLVLPASTMSTTGELHLVMETVLTNTAGAKNVSATFGGAAWISATVTSMAAAAIAGEVRNRNSANVQSFIGNFLFSSAAVAHSLAYGTVNTGASVNIAISSTHSGAATDNIVIETFRVMILNP